MVYILRDAIGMTALWNWLGPDLIASLLTVVWVGVAERLVRILLKKKEALLIFISVAEKKIPAVFPLAVTWYSSDAKKILWLQ